MKTKKSVSKKQVLPVSFKQEINQLFIDFEQGINKRFDEILKEIRVERKEWLLLARRIAEHDKRLGNHEKRILYLENSI